MATSGTNTTTVGAGSTDRSSIRETTARGAVVDGAWWPRSSDLTVELPALLAGLWAGTETDVRVAYHLGTWDAAPRKLFVGARLVRLGGFVHQDPLVISLSGATGSRRLDLLVIAPSTPADVAARILQIAAAPDCRLTPTEVLELAAREAATRPQPVG